MSVPGLPRWQRPNVRESYVFRALAAGLVTAEQLAAAVANLLPQDQINGVVASLMASGIETFVLKAPDNSLHRIAVANDGTLSSVPYVSGG